MKTRMAGFQKPQAEKTKPVGLAIIKVGEGLTTCNCGWSFRHRRTKVLEDRAESHVLAKHGGAAAWM